MDPPVAPGPGVLALWLRSLRAPFLLASAIPLALASLLAFRDQRAINPLLLGLTVVGLASVHLATNMLNDNFDYRSGADLAVKHGNPFAGGSRVLLQGVLGLRIHLAVALTFLAVGVGVGLYLVWLRGPILLAIGLIGVLSAFFYVGPPLRLAHRGVGEFLVGVSFGPLIVLGTYLVLTGHLSPGAALLSLPPGLLVAAVLWINEFPDREADLQAGKRTLMARLGPRASVKVYVGLLALAYLLFVAAAALDVVPLYGLAVLASVPLAAKAVRHLQRHPEDPEGLAPANAGTILVLVAFGVLGCLGFALGILLNP